MRIQYWRRCWHVDLIAAQLLARIANQEIQVLLPEVGRYGAGIVFLPQDAEQRATCKKTVEEFIAQQGQSLLGWRPLPVDYDTADIGKAARAQCPRWRCCLSPVQPDWTKTPWNVNYSSFGNCPVTNCVTVRCRRHYCSMFVHCRPS